MKPLCILVAFAIFLAVPIAAQNQDTTPQKLVPPSAYTYIPKTLRAALDKRGCQLPQLAQYEAKDPWNAASGHFLNSTQTDWAALCIVNDRPRVVVVWGAQGKPACPDEITSGWPLEQSFAHEAGGGLFLAKANAKLILDYRKFFGDTNANPVTHEGINIGDEKASLIYYCDGKSWLQLQGDD
ncbi:MAG TPA: hypothetical protein VFU57_13330 [Candidatus Acidoferrales bacterium]|nr:hypothetical protein [Candidatus Acidoferrales bacterium]